MRAEPIKETKVLNIAVTYKDVVNVTFCEKL